MRKSCSCGLLCVSIVKVYQFMSVRLNPLGFDGGVWDLIVIVPEQLFYCVSKIFFILNIQYQ